MATTKGTSPKVAYIFKESSPAGNGTWHPIVGIASTNANYSWSGTHDFSNDVTFADVLNAKAGINNFQNPTARNSAIPSPQAGTVVFIRQDDSGNVINQIQYYSASGSWTSYVDAQLVSKTANYVLALHDSGKTITMNSSTATTVTVPTNASVAFPLGTVITVLQTGSGATSFVEASGVTIRSKNSYKVMNTQYSGAQLIKLETDVWVLVGDLKA